MKINVAKSGIMHIRKKKVERCNMAYEVDGKAILMVSLGCVLDEYLELTYISGTLHPKTSLLLKVRALPVALCMWETKIYAV